MSLTGGVLFYSVSGFQLSSVISKMPIAFIVLLRMSLSKGSRNSLVVFFPQGEEIKLLPSLKTLPFPNVNFKSLHLLGSNNNFKISIGLIVRILIFFLLQ